MTTFGTTRCRPRFDKPFLLWMAFTAVVLGRSAAFVRRTVPLNTRTSGLLFLSTSKKNEWHVPEKIAIPEDRLEWSFVRSSGAGGQNVNKVNSQAQVRFHLPSANWIPEEVRVRLARQFPGNLNKHEEFMVSAQEHRTQTANRRAALQKIEDMLLQAWDRPKERKMRTGLSKEAKEKRIEMKKRRSQIKEGRRKVESW